MCLLASWSARVVFAWLGSVNDSSYQNIIHFFHQQDTTEGKASIRTTTVVRALYNRLPPVAPNSCKRVRKTFPPRRRCYNHLVVVFLEGRRRTRNPQKTCAMVDPRRHLLLLLLLVLSFTPPSSLFHTLTQHTTCPFILTSLGGWGEEMQFSLMPRRITRILMAS